MNRKTCLMVASVASVIGLFNIENIKLLKSLGYKVIVAANFSHGSIFTEEHSRELWDSLYAMDVDVRNIAFERNTLHWRNIRAYRLIEELIAHEDISLIHCHNPTGGFIARFAARSKRKQGVRVIYTAHGFHFYKGSPLFGWLLFYPIEKRLSKHTDILITINQEDYELANERMKASKVRHVKGVGIDEDSFSLSSDCRLNKRRELGIVSDDSIVFLNIGELNRNKNQVAIIRAFADAFKNNSEPSLCDSYLLFAGVGKEREKCKALAVQLGIADLVFFLGWRTDIPELLAAADVVVSASLREGLPVNLIEAMMAGKPLIASNCRGNRDLAVDGGIVTSSQAELVAAIEQMSKDASLRAQLGKQAKEASKRYSRSCVLPVMREIYELAQGDGSPVSLAQGDGSPVSKSSFHA